MASATGGSTIYTYQWQKASLLTSPLTFSDIPGATATTYQPPALNESTAFRRMVSDRYSPSTYTNAISIIVFEPLEAGAIGGDQEVLAGAPPQKLTNITSPSGGSGSYTCQWEKSANGTDWSAAPGIHNEPDYLPDTLHATAYFRRKAISRVLDRMDTLASNTVTITVYQPVSISSFTGGRQDVMKDNPATPLSITPSGGNGIYTYEWQRSTDGNLWITITGNDTCTPPTHEEGLLYYRCIVGSFNTFDTSGVAEIQVYPYFKGGVIAHDQKIIENNRPDAITSLHPADEHAGCTANYQWELSTDGITFNPVPDATAATYLPDTLFATTLFRRGATCGSDTGYTNVVTITVVPVLKAMKGLNSAQTLLAGSVPDTLYAVATGGDGAYTYQWMQSHNKTVWEATAGGHDTLYAPPALQDTTYYYCKINSFGMTDYTDTVAVNMYPAFTAGNIGGNQKVLPGEMPLPFLGVPSEGGICHTRSYQWQDSSGYGKWKDIAGATAATYQPEALEKTTQFRRRVRLACTGETLYSNVAQVGLAGRIADDQIVAKDGIIYPLTGVDPLDDNGFTYQWQDSTTAKTWQNITTATAESYQPAGIEKTPGTYYYRRVVTGSRGVASYSNVLTITVKNGPLTLDYYTPPAGSTSGYPINYIVTCTPFEAVKDVADLSLSKQKQASTVNYYDGLGRLTQTIRPLHTLEGNDLVQWKTYDAAGRESKQYLPYPKANSTAGVFVPFEEALREQQTFYGDEGQYAFLENIYEPSPLNRVVALQGQGKAWQDKPVKTGYQTNTAPVNSWRANEDNSFTAFTYAANQLYVTQTTDENSNLSRVYKDKQDRVVMTEAHDGSQWLQTRYVYDDFGLVRAVLQPEAGSPDNEDYCFYYRYDERRRAIETKTPGADWIYVIYDKRDRQVMTQDGNQWTNNRWTLYTYDDFNREIRREEVQVQGRLSRETMQWLYENSEPPYTERVVMSEAWYDTSPQPPPKEGEKDFSFEANEVAKDSHLAASNKGRITMNKVRVLSPSLGGGQGEVVTAFYYDNYGRVIQTVAENIIGGIDRVSHSYDFTGNVTESKQVSTWAGDGDPGTLTLTTTFGYDALKRPTTVRLQLNEQDPVTVSALEYDELVRLKTKKLHNDKEIIDYSYNIRDWITAINSNFFTEELFYDKPLGDVAPQYNGNISAMRWHTARQTQQAYVFEYDAVNRLVKSQYAEGSNSEWGNNYTEQLAYDKNGNITALQRYRHFTEPIDNLFYTYNGNQVQQIADDGTPDGYPQGTTRYEYDANGNNTFEGTRVRVAYNEINLPKQVQLLGGRGIKNVYAADGRKLKTEAKQGSEYIKEGTKTYCGNLVFDINDELDYIIFPEGRILYNIDDSTFKYEYHLKDHLGSTRVAFVPTTSGTEVVQENSYYPFGAPIADLSWSPKSTNRYKREGKEYISDFDWNKYDFTGRTFDTWTLRALQVDPMATKYYNTSPYALWVNNPLRVIDPTGMWTDDPQQKQQPTTYDDLNFLQKMFYNIYSLMNAQGKAVNEMHGKTETTEEENMMASIEYITGTVLLLQAHTEMARSAGQVSSSNKTSAVKEATIPESIAAPANAVKAESRYLYHYTSRAAADNILKTGLSVTEKRPFIYTTNVGNLSPLQAQIELALPAERALPNSILQIDTKGLSPFIVRPVQGNLPGMGAGGGTEFLFNQNIPANRIIIIK